MHLPFAHLNLRENPFATPSPERVASLAVVDVERFVTPLRERDFVVQFIGEQGRGKSTHMRALHARFSSAPFLYFPEDEPHPRIPWQAPILFLDETQRLSWWTRRKLWRGKKGLAIATHVDHSAEFTRAGITHHTIEIKGLTLEKLEAIITRRVEAARRSPGDTPWLEPEDLNALIEHFGDDLRAIESLLYDVFQRAETIARLDVQAALSAMR